MDNMNNTISQESIDSLNNFIANYERERDARNARIMRERIEYDRLLQLENEALQESISYKVAQFIREAFELIVSGAWVVCKCIFVMFCMLAPFALIELVERIF